MILVVVVFALLWLPIHVFLLLVFFYGPPSNANWHEAVFVLCTGLAYFNSCVNPIIYNRTSKDFRDAFRAAVGCQKHDGGDAGTEVAVPLKASRMVNAADAAAAGQELPRAAEDADCVDGKILVEN